MGLFRFRLWPRRSERTAPDRREVAEDLDGLVRRNRAAYADLQAALEALLAARNDGDETIGRNLRHAYERLDRPVPPRLQGLLERLREQEGSRTRSNASKVGREEGDFGTDD